MAWPASAWVDEVSGAVVLTDVLRCLLRAQHEGLRARVVETHEDPVLDIRLLPVDGWERAGLEATIASRWLYPGRLVEDESYTHDLLRDVELFRFDSARDSWVNDHDTFSFADAHDVAEVLASLVHYIFVAGMALEVAFLVPPVYGRERYSVPTPHDLRLSELKREADYWRSQP